MLGSKDSLGEFHIRDGSLVEHQAYQLHMNTQLDRLLRDIRNTVHMDLAGMDELVLLASAYTAQTDFRSNLVSSCRTVYD